MTLSALKLNLNAKSFVPSASSTPNSPAKEVNTPTSPTIPNTWPPLSSIKNNAGVFPSPLFLAESPASSSSISFSNFSLIIPHSSITEPNYGEAKLVTHYTIKKIPSHINVLYNALKEVHFLFPFIEPIKMRKLQQQSSQDSIKNIINYLNNIIIKMNNTELYDSILKNTKNLLKNLMEKNYSEDTIQEMCHDILVYLNAFLKKYKDPHFNLGEYYSMSQVKFSLPLEDCEYHLPLELKEDLE